MSTRWQKYLIFSGVLAVILWIVGIFFMESGSPSENATPEATLAYYQDNETSILTGGFLFALGAFFFLWFVAALWSHLRSAEGAGGLFSLVALLSGGLVSGFLLAMGSASMVPLFDVDNLTAPLAQTFFRLTDVFFFSAEIMAAALVVATGVLALSTRALPAWFGWVSFALGLWLLVAPVGWAGLIFGLPIWTVATSLLVFFWGDRVRTRRLEVTDEELIEERRRRAA